MADEKIYKDCYLCKKKVDLNGRTTITIHPEPILYAHLRCENELNRQQNISTARGVNVRSIANANTVKASFRVCCNHNETKIPCTTTMNAIKKIFNNVVKIQTTKPYDGAEDMCVIGTAIIKPSMRKQFENDLKIKINKNEFSIKIKKSIVNLHQ